MTARFIGMDEVERALNTLLPREALNASRGGTLALAKRGRDIAREEVPVETGRLKRSLKHRRVRGTRNVVGAVVEADFYAAMVNGGTVAAPANGFIDRTIARLNSELPKLAVEEFGKKIESQLAKRAKRR